MRRFVIASLVLLTCLSPLIAPEAITQEPVDGRDRPFRDEFIDRLAGKWKLSRKFKGRTVENTVNAEWVLNHQFLLLHMKDVNNPPAYEAMVYIGYDNASERYVVHWIDVFGGRFSEASPGSAGILPASSPTTTCRQDACAPRFASREGRV